MTESNEQKPTRSLAELSGRRVTISEERPLQVNQGRNSAVIDEGRNITTIDELNRAFLPPDQAKQLRDKLSDKTAKIKNHEAPKKRWGNDEGRIFEEADIIDWMFKNIIIKSMDWTANKAVNITSAIVGYSLDKTTDFVGSAAKRAGHGLQKQWDKWNPYNGGFNQFPDDNTTQFRKTVAGFYNSEMKDCDAYASEDSFNVMMNAMRLASEGRVDDLNTMMNGRLSPETMTMLNALSPEQRQQLFSQDNAMEYTQNTIETVMDIKQYSANMAYVRLMTEKMNDKDQPKKDASTLFAEYQEEARVDMLTYLKEASAAGKSDDTIKQEREELVNLSIEAGKHVDKQIEKRNYNEYDNNKPSKNSALEKIESMMVISKESPYRNQTHLDGFMSEVIQASVAHQQAMNPVQQEENVIAARFEGNQQRRDNLRQVMQNIQQRRNNANTNTTANTQQRAGNQGRV